MKKYYFRQNLRISILALGIFGSAQGFAVDLTFTGGSLVSAENWDIDGEEGTKLPSAEDDFGVIEVDGAIGATTVNFGAATVTMSSGTISTNAANNNFNFLGGGTFILEGGDFSTRGIFANGQGGATAIELKGGTVQLGTTSNTSVRFGSVNGGSMTISGTVTVDADQGYIISADPVGTGILDILSDWTGTWRHPSYTESEWLETLVAVGATVDSEAISAANFINLFTVSDDGTTLSLGPPKHIPLSIVQNSTTPSTFDFEWESSTGNYYDLVSSTDLTIPTSQWEVWDGNENIVATSPLNTLTQISGSTDRRRFFLIREKSSVEVYFEDFENDDGNFVASGTSNDWAHGNPASDNGFSLVIDSGNNESLGCWGTELGTAGEPSGFIQVGVSSVLRTPDFDFSTSAGGELTFAAAIDADSGDTFTIRVREALTSTVLQTIEPITFPLTANWSTYGPYALGGADNSQFYLEFEFVGSSAQFIGVYLDDISLSLN